MFDKAGEFIGDKVGAVQGKLRTNRYRLNWPGRKSRTIRRARRKAAERGRSVGRVTGWISTAARFLFGIFF